MSLVALVATATVGYMVYRGALDSLMNSAGDRVEHTSETIVLRTWGTLDAIGDDVKFLARTPQARGIVRATLEGGYDRMWSIHDDEWGTLLADLMREFLESRSAFLQARLIGLGNDGRELVRVERRRGRAVFADVETLASLGDEEYVTEAVELPEGNLYFSEVLRSDGSGDIPKNLPIVHISTPVYSEAGEVFGVVAVTVDFMEVLAPVQRQVDENQTLYVANSMGEVLLISEGSEGAQRVRPDSLQSLFPEAEQLIAGEPTDIRMLEARLGRETRGIAYFEEVSLSSSSLSPSLLIGISEPHETILTGVRRIRNQSAAITLLLCLAAVLVALGSARYFTTPLRQITKATSSFGEEGDSVALPVDRDDEIGILARSFEAMQAQIEDQIRVLEDDERLQRTILETSAEGIMVTDAEGRIETFNPAAETIFNRAASDVRGVSVGTLLSEHTLQDVIGDGRFETGRQMEVEGIRADGSRIPVLLLWSTFEWREERKITIFVQDITERKRAEDAQADLVKALESERKRLRELSATLESRVRDRTAELERLNLDLEASNRELREIAKVASHDLQEPLRKLRSFADLLQREYGESLDEQGRFYARRIYGLAERMSRLIADLLAFSRVTATPRQSQRIELNDLVRGLAAEIDASRPELDVAFEIASLPPVEADPLQMRELFAHLLENAVNFRRADTMPRVQVRPLDGDGGADEFCRIEVSDNGVGFDPKYADRIFAPFERLIDGRRVSSIVPSGDGDSLDASLGEWAGEVRRGTGMGLTICRRIAENHGGSITARSTPGEGSTFVVTLPKA